MHTHTHTNAHTHTHTGIASYSLSECLIEDHEDAFTQRKYASTQAAGRSTEEVEKGLRKKQRRRYQV
jgi:hypothetical protein